MFNSYDTPSRSFSAICLLTMWNRSQQRSHPCCGNHPLVPVWKIPPDRMGLHSACLIWVRGGRREEDGAGVGRPGEKSSANGLVLQERARSRRGGLAAAVAKGQREQPGLGRNRTCQRIRCRRVRQPDQIVITIDCYIKGEIKPGVVGNHQLSFRQEDGGRFGGGLVQSAPCTSNVLVNPLV